MTTTQLWIPEDFNLRAVARSNLVFNFAYAPGGVPTNLPTGTSIRCTVKRTQYSLTPAISIDGTAGIVVVTNTATITFTAAQLNLDCGFYSWLLEATISSQEVALARGILDVSPSPA